MMMAGKIKMLAAIAVILAVTGSTISYSFGDGAKRPPLGAVAEKSKPDATDENPNHGILERIGNLTFDSYSLGATTYTSPDGKYVVTQGEDSTIRAWHTDTGKHLWVKHLERFCVLPEPVAISPASDEILLGVGRKVYVLALADGAVKNEYPAFSADVEMLSFVPNSDRFIVATLDRRMHWVDRKTGQVSEFHSGRGRFALGMPTQHPSGDYLVTSGSAAHEFNLWDMKEMVRIRTVKTPHYAGAMAFSKDGRRMLRVSNYYNVSMFDTTTWEPVWSVEARSGNGRYNFGSFSPDEKLIVAANPYGFVSIDAASGKIVCARDIEYDAYTRVNRTPQFVLDGKAIRVGNRMWDLKTGEELKGPDQKSISPRRPVRAVVSRTGEIMVTMDPDSAFRTCNLKTGEVSKLFRAPKGYETVCGLALSPDGSVLAVGGLQGYLTLIDTRPHEELTKLKGLREGVRGIVFSSDGTSVAAAGGNAPIFQPPDPAPDSDFSIRIWDVKTGKQIKIVTEDAGGDVVRDLFLSRDGKHLYSFISGGRVGHNISQWAVSTGKLVRKFSSKHGSEAIALSTDEKLVAFAGDHAALAVHNLGSGECVHVLLNSDSTYDPAVTAVAFIDGHSPVLVSGHGNGVLRLWRMDTGKCVATITEHSAPVNSISPVPGTRRFVTASADKTAIVWDLDRLLEDPPREIEMLLGRDKGTD